MLLALVGRFVGWVKGVELGTAYMVVILLQFAIEVGISITLYSVRLGACLGLCSGV